MQQGYFKTAWSDLTSSPSWASRMLLVSLVAVIPIFGSIVKSGYFLGWARDAAWGVNTPLPKRIFANEDGKLYSRGFFAWVIATICLLLPCAILAIGLLLGTGSASVLSFISSDVHRVIRQVFDMPTALSAVTVVVFFVALFFSLFFSMVGQIRMSIYGRLSAGLQLGVIWQMIRRDFKGLLRILGMAVILMTVGSLISGMVHGLWRLGAFAFAFALFVVGADPQTSGILALFGLFMLAFLLTLFNAFVFQLSVAFCEVLTFRAVGHWTAQFNVPLWRGQDDPLPPVQDNFVPPMQDTH